MGDFTRTPLHAGVGDPQLLKPQCAANEAETSCLHLRTREKSVFFFLLAVLLRHVHQLENTITSVLRQINGSLLASSVAVMRPPPPARRVAASLVPAVVSRYSTTVSPIFYPDSNCTPDGGRSIAPLPRTDDSACSGCSVLLK